MKKRHDGRNKPWVEFTAWCRRRKLNYLPAHPWTVAAYFRWCELRKPFFAIEEARKAIARAHILKRRGAPHRHQTVKRTLLMIELRALHRGLYGDLFLEEDFTADENNNAAPENHHPAGRRSQSMRSRPPLVSRRR
mgnify:CR=1 FL=1